MAKPKISKEHAKANERINELVKIADERRWKINGLEADLEKVKKEKDEHMCYHARYCQIESENGYLRDLVAGLTKTRHTPEENGGVPIGGPSPYFTNIR